MVLYDVHSNMKYNVPAALSRKVFNRPFELRINALPAIMMTLSIALTWGTCHCRKLQEPA